MASGGGGAFVTLKVLITRTGQTKAMRFPSEMTIAEILKEIQLKTEEGGADHGLFQEADGTRKSRWLKAMRNLRYYGINSGMTLEYKKKSRPLKFKLMDDSVKTVIIDDSLFVGEIIKIIGERLGLKSTDEFGLQPDTEKGKWLNDAQTLHEQDVGENDMVVFCRRYFGNEVENVDSEDPMALHLFYIESNRGIIDGAYPVTRDEARDLAVIQFQIVYGNHDPAKHKPGWMDKKLFLPLQWRKDKKIEAEILKEHRKMVGMTETNAKYRYVQYVRLLKTFGITFFEVKEKVKNKRKPQPALLGITREKIMKVDWETKEVVKEWSLEWMRRWAAANNSFTLDFGDYEDDYVNFLTDEGDAISQLIGGYIDILLKARQSTGRDIDDDSATIAAEEELAPAMGSAVATTTTAMSATYGSSTARPGVVGGIQGVGGAMNVGGLQGYSIGGAGGLDIPASQRIEIIGMSSAMEATRLLSDELAGGLEGYEATGSLTGEQWLSQLGKHQETIQKHAEELLKMTRHNPESLNRNDLDNQAKVIAMEVFNLASAARNAAALSPDDLPLLSGAKAVSDSITSLLQLVSNAVDNPQEATLKQQLDDAERAILAAHLLLNEARHASHVDKGAELFMAECINDAVLHFDRIVESGVHASPSIEDPAQRGQFDTDITRTKAGKEWLVNTLQSLMMAATTPNVRQQMQTSSGEMESLATALVQSGQRSGLQQATIQQMSYSAGKLNESLRYLMEAAKTAERRGAEGEIELTTPANMLIASLAQLRANIDDTNKMVGHTRDTAKAGNQLIAAAKVLANGSSDDTRERLLRTGKEMHQSMQGLLDNARTLARAPEDTGSRDRLLASAKRLEDSASLLLSDGGRTAALSNLRYHAKKATASLVHLHTATHLSSESIDDHGARNALLEEARSMVSSMSWMLSTLQVASSAPDDDSKQHALLESARQSLPGFSNFNVAVKRNTRHVRDANQKHNLTFASTETSEALNDLMRAVEAAGDLDNQGEIEESLAEFDTVQADLDAAEFAARQNVLVSDMNTSREDALALLKLACSSLTDSVVALIGDAKAGRKLVEPIRDASAAAAQVATASRAMATTIADRQTKTRIILAAKDVTSATLDTLSSSRALVLDVDSADKVRQTDAYFVTFESNVATLIAVATGLDAQECDEAARVIREAAAMVNSTEPTSTPFKQAADNLVATTRALSAAVGQLVSMARSNPSGLGSAAKMTATTARQVLSASTVAASSNTDRNAGQAIVEGAQGAGETLAQLLMAAKSTAVNRNDQTLAGLNGAFGTYTQALQALVGLLTSVSPEAEEAIRIIEAALARLDSGDLSNVAAMNRAALLAVFTEASRSLASVTQRIVSSARASPGKMGTFSKEAATTVSEVVDATRAAQKAAEGGAGGPPAGGPPPRPGGPKAPPPGARKLPPQPGGAPPKGPPKGPGSRLTAPGLEILKYVTFILRNPGETAKALACAKHITEGSSKLIELTKQRAAAMTDKALQQRVMKIAKLHMNATVRLVESSKIAHVQQTQEAIQQLGECAHELKNRTQEIEQVLAEAAGSSGPGAAGGSGSGVSRGTADQLVAASRAVGVATQGLIRAAGRVAANDTNDAAARDLSQATKEVSDSIHALIAACGALNPGIQECDRALRVLADCASQLDSLTLAAALGNLTSQGTGDKSSRDSHDAVMASAKDIAEDITRLAQYTTVDELVAAARSVQTHFPALVRGTKEMATRSPDQNSQTNLLTLAKAVTDNMSGLVKAVRDLNPDRTVSVQLVGKASQDTSSALAELLSSLQTGVALADELSAIINRMQTALGELGKPFAPGATSRTYQQYRSELETAARELAGGAQQLVRTEVSNLGQISLNVARLADALPKLIEMSRAAIATTAEQQAKIDIAVASKAVSENLIGMVTLARDGTQGADIKRPMQQAFGSTSQSIGQLLLATKKGAIGEVLCDQAIQAINEAVNQLNTSSIFAQAGQLEIPPPARQSTMAALNDRVRKVCNDMSKCSADIDQSVSASDEALGKTAMNLGNMARFLAGAATQSASRVADSVAQQEILSSAKALAIAAHQIILAAKDAQNRPEDTTAKQTLTASKGGVADSAAQLLQVIEAAGAEAARAERELEKARQAIMAALADTTVTAAVPEDVIVAARKVLKAVADGVFSTTQEEVISAATASSESVGSLLTTARGAAALSPDANVTQRVVSASQKTANHVMELLETGKLDRSDPQTSNKLEQDSEKVSTSINELVSALRELPDAENLSLDEGTDLEALAESELLRCAEIIKEAANTLLQARPRRTPKTPGVLDEEDINAAIMDAARAIAQATGNLVESAATAQQERKERVKTNQAKYHNDPTWANGLISAAQSVAASVKELVSAANAGAQGKVEEELLVAAARAVAASTQQLVAASRAKADPSSKSQQALAMAAKAVANATSQLVNAARQAAQYQDTEEDADWSFSSVAAARKAEMEQQVRILKLEKELEKERRRMGAMNRAAYGNK